MLRNAELRETINTRVTGIGVKSGGQRTDFAEPEQRFCNLFYPSLPWQVPPAVHVREGTRVISRSPLSLPLSLSLLSPLFLQVSVEVLVEYPFFVFGQGWSSCCPERTSQLFDLPCSKLSVGDVCISLTLKNLKNGSIKKGQPMDSASILLKHSKNDSLAGSRHRYVEQENGINQGSAQMLAENGELKFPDKIGLPAAPLLTKTEPSKPPATRKRRWSAPETRKLEKSEEEPPLTLPKPSFIPQEVKICIEGRSNVGK